MFGRSVSLGAAVTSFRVAISASINQPMLNMVLLIVMMFSYRPVGATKVPIRIKKNVSSLNFDQNYGPSYVTGCCHGSVKTYQIFPGHRLLQYRVAVAFRWCHPGRGCLECLKQYNSGLVSTEREGFLDDPSYIQGLSEDHSVKRNENVFPFGVTTSGFEVQQLLSMVIAPSGKFNVSILPASCDLEFSCSMVFKVFVPRGPAEIVLAPGSMISSL